MAVSSGGEGQGEGFSIHRHPPGKNILNCEFEVAIREFGWLISWTDEFLISGG